MVADSLLVRIGSACTEDLIVALAVLSLIFGIVVGLLMVAVYFEVKREEWHGFQGVL